VSFNLTKGAAAEVVRFIDKVHKVVLVKKQRVFLDFQKTEKFIVPGAILLFAELSRIVESAVFRKPITVLPPKNDKAKQVLKQIGLFELTQDEVKVVTKDDDVVNWCAKSGTSNDSPSYGALLENVSEHVLRTEQLGIETKDLFRSVSEAVSNAVEHAYKYPREDGFSGLKSAKWWMFTHVKDQTLTVAICDLGCGYKKTLARDRLQFVKDSFPSMFSKKTMNFDALAIHSAMIYGRTQTGKGHRGKGMKDVLSVLNCCQVGQLYILSNTAWVQYAKHKNSTELTHTSAAVKTNIKGTIVWWNLTV
jgi:hypothetical protein